MQSNTPNRFPASSMLTLTADSIDCDLAESVGPDLQLSQAIGDDALAALASLSLEYGSAHGDLALRELIADSHEVDAADVVTTIGGIHAIFLTGAILCNRGDHVLLQQPGFPLTHSALAFGHADVSSIACSFDSAYRVDVDALATRLRANTTLVCLASPQNPSGVAIPPQSISAILDAMAERCPQAFLLLDETYRQADYGDTEPLASPVSTDQRIISIASLSKCHGAPGLRIGWTITRHRGMREQLINGKFQTVIACSGLDEAVATRLLLRERQLLLKRRRHLRLCRDTVAGWVTANADYLDWVTPHAGALCCVRLNPARFNSTAMQRFHGELKRHALRVAPGEWFGDEPNVFRLGFGLLPLSQLKHGLEVIGDAIANLG